jgi:hypothetical protein
MYDTSSCGAGPEQGARLRVRLKWDADGSDHQNVNGEWIEIRNFGSAPASIGGWTVHFSDSRRYHFRSSARVPAGGRVRLHIGHGRNTPTDYYWGFGHPIFDDHLGDGAYLFDPGGDLRAWMMYPCRFRCTDALQGKVRLSAQPRGQSESVSIRNVSASSVDIDGYVLALPFHQYDFLGNATIGPGETMIVDVQGDPRNDTRLHKYYGFNRTMLADGGDVVRLQTYNDIVVGCTAWGRGRC